MDAVNLSGEGSHAVIRVTKVGKNLYTAIFTSPSTKQVMKSAKPDSRRRTFNMLSKAGCNFKDILAEFRTANDEYAYRLSQGLLIPSPQDATATTTEGKVQQRHQNPTIT